MATETATASERSEQQGLAALPVLADRTTRRQLIEAAHPGWDLTAIEHELNQQESDFKRLQKKLELDAWLDEQRAVRDSMERGTYKRPESATIGDEAANPQQRNEQLGG